MISITNCERIIEKLDAGFSEKIELNQYVLTSVFEARVEKIAQDKDMGVERVCVAEIACALYDLRQRDARKRAGRFGRMPR